MEATTVVAPPPQRVCPKCARISYATGPRCPYCTARFSAGRTVTPWMLVGAAVAVLVGVAIMLLIAGRIFEDHLNDRVQDVTKSFDQSLKQFQTDVQKELDARLPAGGAGTVPAVPTTTPFPTETPTVAPTTESTPSPTATASPTTTAEATATADHTEIRP
ncbi:hypothetical protein [Solirubrobacter soli]|uniref:hypothetical protein n=1 Tax=Solirubrobacter soli TaxID=363832 RepID=UPI0004865AC1|nr:hypothetical protein [Solirubrobacter soli]